MCCAIKILFSLFSFINAVIDPLMIQELKGVDLWWIGFPLSDLEQLRLLYSNTALVNLCHSVLMRLVPSAVYKFFLFIVSRHHSAAFA